MSDMELPFFVGTVDDFTCCGVDTTNLRKSVDGTQAIIHMHNLTMEQFNEVRFKVDINAVTHEEALTLMGTPEWIDS